TDNRTVVPRGVTSNPIDIDFSAEERKIYWTDEFAAIRRADLDGSHIEDLVRTSGVTGIALDIPHHRFYWAEKYGRVRRASLDGEDVEEVGASQFVAFLPIGLALDTTHGKIYWTDLANDTIGRANTDGSEIDTLVSLLPDGAFNPMGMAIDVAGGKVY